MAICLLLFLVGLQVVYSLVLDHMWVKCRMAMQYVIVTTGLMEQASNRYSGYIGDNGDLTDAQFNGIASLPWISFPYELSNNTFNTFGKPSRWNALGLYACNLGKPLICVQQ